MTSAYAVEPMTGPRLWLSLLKWRLIRLRNRFIPHLVWRNDEIDVVVTFKEARLPQIEASSPEELFAAVLPHLDYGRLAEIERMLAEIGITFDKGASADGRDWEMDFSLRGPISVRFRRRAQHPERRV